VNGQGARRDSPGIAVVGASWRTANTELRAKLASVAGEVEPIAALRSAGYLSGAVCVTTCSRTEWIVTSAQPEWAATLLRGALASRVDGLGPEQLQVRVGHGAAHYLMRVVVGLDSVAEGEGAVGRQVLRAFERARVTRTTDRHLNRVARHLARLLNERRDTVPVGASRGVQSLVREVLLERPVRTVAVLGRGEFGQAMERALVGARRWDVSGWSRQSLDELLARMGALDALVVATGAAHAWLNLPSRRTPGVCVDAGSPPQVRSAPGWTMVGLDELLARPELHLEESARLRLEALVDEAAVSLARELSAPVPASALAAIDAERTAFLNEALPALLEGLPPAQARRVRQAVGAFTHQLLRHAREARA
jgi:glutamyl-tRNA reductase